MAPSNCDQVCTCWWRTRRWSLLGALPALAIAAGSAGGGDCTGFPCGNNGNKVLICHVPPGNPDNAHTICISPNAVPDHFANHEGDHCGECVPGDGKPVYAGDVGGDGLVGVEDLLQVVGSWGACPAQPGGCAADLDEDGRVGVTDFLSVVMNWD